MVHILNARTSKVPCLMHLLRSLLLAAARNSFSFSAQLIPGVTNSIADALSRFHCLLRFWPVPFSTLPSKCISLG